jgi:hypothetical protein
MQIVCWEEDRVTICRRNFASCMRLELRPCKVSVLVLFYEGYHWYCESKRGNTTVALEMSKRVAVRQGRECF